MNPFTLDTCELSAHLHDLRLQRRLGVLAQGEIPSIGAGRSLTITSCRGVGCKDSSPLTPTAPQAALRASVTAAPASSTEFDGFINFCVSEDPSKFKFTPGGTIHFGVSNENRWVTGNPLIDGIEHNTGAANINLNNGQVVVRLDLSLKPDAVNGTWEIEQQVRPPDGSTGVGHGTGDLQGMTIKFTTEPAGGTSVCNPDMPKAPVHGVILSPAS